MEPSRQGGGPAFQEAGFDPVRALRDLPQFVKLGETAIRAAARSAEALCLRRGKAAYYQGDMARAAFLVASGTLRTVMYRSDESSMEVGRLGAGEWAGATELLLESPYLTDAVAEDACRLLVFNRSAFDALLGMNGMKDFFLRILARRLYTLHGRIGLTHPLARIVHYILSEREAAGGPDVKRTQEEIAEAVGVTRETVNKHLGLLQERELIRTGRGGIEIVNVEGLKDLLV
jgi:CRP-like cAMP-binding protein